MSYFPDMFRSAKDITSYVMHVNSHEECVIYVLDGDGKPASMACGSVIDVIGDAVKEIGRNVRLVRLGPDEGDRHFPFNYGLSESCWMREAKILNGKGRSAGMDRERLDLLRRYEVDMPYIERNSRTGEYTVTPKGEKFDREMFAEIDAARAAREKGGSQ